MQTITHKKLAEIIANSTGAMPVGLLTETDAKARKTGNPFGVITKRVRSVGFVGANYEKAVNRESERQGGTVDFVAKPRPWGEWVIPNKLATHKGGFYLRTQSTPGQRKRNRAKVLFYRGENGQFIPRDEARKFIPEKAISARQLDVGVGQATGGEQVDVREYSFDSILLIRIAGKTYQVKKGNPLD